MREIKFRAYHKIRKEMYSVHGWHSEYVFKDTLDGIGCEGNPDKLEDVELMQFTGLKDKFGNEIYEADIVNPFSDQEDYAQVIFNNGEFGIYTQNIKGGFYRWTFIQTEIEVIGNIYEDDHLVIKITLTS